MKKIFYYFAAVIISFVMFSCSNETGNVSEHTSNLPAGKHRIIFNPNLDVFDFTPDILGNDPLIIVESGYGYKIKGEKKCDNKSNRRCLVWFPEFPLMYTETVLNSDKLTATVSIDSLTSNINFYFYDDYKNTQIENLLANGFFDLDNDSWLDDIGVFTALGLTEQMRLLKGYYPIYYDGVSTYAFSVPYTFLPNYNSPIYLTNHYYTYHYCLTHNDEEDFVYVKGALDNPAIVIWSVPKVHLTDSKIELYFFRNWLNSDQQVYYDYILANGYDVAANIIIDDFYIMNELGLDHGIIIPMGHYEIAKDFASSVYFSVIIDYQQ